MSGREEFHEAMAELVTEWEAAETQAENTRRRAAAEAFCESIRSHEHWQCIIPYFNAVVLPALDDDHLVVIADEGSMALADNDPI